MLYDLTYMWNLKKPNPEKQRVDWWLPKGRGIREMGDVGPKIQTSNYKMSKFQRPNIYQYEYT